MATRTTSTATTTAYGSITIVDVTDVGEFSATPESNMPTTVIYDPNTNKYNPDWVQTTNGNETSGTPLILSVAARYAGNPLGTNSLYSIRWYRRNGVDPWPNEETGAIGTSSNEDVYVNQYNQLIVKNNILGSNTKIVTFRCVVQYKEPVSQAILTAKGDISFSLVENASQLKYCNIVGGSAFLYDSNKDLVEKEIALTAQRTNNITITKWEYYEEHPKEGDTKGWKPIAFPSDPSHIKGVLYVNAYSHKFGFKVGSSVVYGGEEIPQLRNGKTIQIKVFTSDPNTYSEHTIYKIEDGRHGDNLEDIRFSNEDQVIPFSWNEQEELVGNYSLANTTVSVLKGNEDVTANWTISVYRREQVEGTFDSEEHFFQVTKLNSDVGYVEFKAVKNDNSITLYKKFTLSKVTTGIDGKDAEFYTIETNTPMINISYTYDANGSKLETKYSHSSITFSAYLQKGNMTALTEQYFVIKDDQGTSLFAGITSSKTININSLTNIATIKYLKCDICASPDSTDTPIKTMTVSFVREGEKGVQGEQGIEGTGAISFLLSNINDQISCDSNGIVIAKQTITIPFSALQGITSIRSKLQIVNPSELPSGMSCSNPTVEISSGAGQLVIDVARDSNLGGADNGTIDLLATCWGTASGSSTTIEKSTPYVFKWTKNKQGIKGDDALLLRLNTPNGNIIEDEGESLSIVAGLYAGANETNNVSYTWYKHVVGADKTVTYTEVPGENDELHEVSGDGKTLTIYRDAINGYASYKCVATYNGKTYEAYQDVEDWVDELQVSLHCTLGNQLLNSVGNGAVYTKVTSRRTGELDPLKSDLFLLASEVDAAIENNSLNTLLGGKTKYYKLTPDSGENPNKVEYVYLDGSTWITQSMDVAHPKYNYSYSFRGVTGGVLTDTKFATSGKVIYIDASLVNKKVIIDVAVSKKQ